MNDPMETLLRQNDPAAGRMLTTLDRAQILKAATERRGAPLSTKMRLAFALALLLIIVSAIAFRSNRREMAPRQVQYATPGGTRIVWSLDPNFRM